MKVFVYGTLRKFIPTQGCTPMVGPNFAQLEGAEFFDFATTVEPYPLVIEGQYGSPPMLDAQGHGHRVRGEIWEVDEEILARLDKLERVPELFVRKLITVQPEKGGHPRYVYCYLFPHFDQDRLENGEYETYPEYTAELAEFYIPLDQRGDLQKADAAYRKEVEG